MSPCFGLAWQLFCSRAEVPRGLKRFGTRLHDEYLLPQRLWSDFEAILAELENDGFELDRRIYRDIWNWRFPAFLDWKKSGARLIVRKALENWPLLCETPIEGGTTSRFVDTSMQRLEFCGDSAFNTRYRIYVTGRPLELRQMSADTFLSGLRVPANEPLPVNAPRHPDTTSPLPHAC